MARRSSGARLRARAFRLWAGVVAIVVGALFIAPVVWMAAASLKPDDTIHRDVGSLSSFLPAPVTFDNYADAARRGDIGVVMLNTAVVVAVVILGGLLINSAAAYAFARMRLPGGEWLFLALVATIIVPLEAIVIPLFVAVQSTRDVAAWTGQRTWTLAALSLPFAAKAFNIFLLRQSFLTLPRTLEEAAFIDGAGWWRTFMRVALPNVRHTLVTVVLLDFVIHWNDFLWPLVISQHESTRTVQLGLGLFFTQPPISWGAIMAYSVLATAPVMLAFLVGQRWIVPSLASTGTNE